MINSNKMKEIKYFSYSPQNINLFNSIKNSNKNKQPKKNVSSNQNLSEEMEIEKDDNTNEINKLKRIPKLELLKRITKMKKDFQENSLYGQPFQFWFPPIMLQQQQTIG